jgi:hypothetical protein
MIRFSILDLAFVPEGAVPADALTSSSPTPSNRGQEVANVASEHGARYLVHFRIPDPDEVDVKRDLR